MIERFILKETKNGNVEGYLESNPAVKVCACPAPELVGARMLLDAGFDPTALLTAKWEGSDHDSLVPAEIGKLGKLTTSETEEFGMIDSLGDG